MRDAKNRGTAGFSLVEVLTAITVLGLMLAPIGASLVLSHRLNARSQQLMEDQLAVANAVETLMAEGIKRDKVGENGDYTGYDNAAVKVQAISNGAAYQVTVSSANGVTVKTYIRPADTDEESQEVEPPNEA